MLIEEYRKNWTLEVSRGFQDFDLFSQGGWSQPLYSFLCGAGVSDDASTASCEIGEHLGLERNVERYCGIFGLSEYESVTFEGV